MWFLIVLLCSSLGFAQPQPALPQPAPSNVQTLRQGILEFEYDPDGGDIIVRLSDATITKPLEAKSLKLEAISDGGTHIKATLQQKTSSVFQGNLPLSEGEWNLVAKVQTPSQELDGQFILGVGKAVSEGRFPLTPLNPEVGRLSWLVGMLLGVPLGLGLLIGVYALLQKVLGLGREKINT